MPTKEYYIKELKATLRIYAKALDYLKSEKEPDVDFINSIEDNILRIKLRIKHLEGEDYE